MTFYITFYDRRFKRSVLDKGGGLDRIRDYRHVARKHNKVLNLIPVFIFRLLSFPPKS